MFYFRDLKHIPKEAWQDITQSYIRHNKPISSNFPTIDEILEMWDAWRRDHPEKIKSARDTLVNCINFWESKSKNLYPFDDDEAKLYRGVYYNMAVAYLWLNEFDLAYSNLEKSIIDFWAVAMNSGLRGKIKDRRIRYERSFK